MEEIVRGIGPARLEHLNLTLPDSRDREYALSQDDLAIIGMPVYAGRLPAEAVARLRKIKGNNAAAVIVVVYGNRAYEDALVELQDVAQEAGFRPVAAAAFIGEHSYATDDAHIAWKRPDQDDLARAFDFGQKVRESLGQIADEAAMPSLQVPGNRPYQESRLPKNLTPLSHEFCTRCEDCISLCPTGAIALSDNAIVTDASLCILCCACVKACTTGARAMEDERIQKMRAILTTKFSERREPEMFYLAAMLD